MWKCIVATSSVVPRRPSRLREMITLKGAEPFFAGYIHFDINCVCDYNDKFEISAKIHWDLMMNWKQENIFFNSENNLWYYFLSLKFDISVVTSLLGSWPLLSLCRLHGPINFVKRFEATIKDIDFLFISCHQSSLLMRMTNMKILES